MNMIIFSIILQPFNMKIKEPDDIDQVVANLYPHCFTKIKSIKAAYSLFTSFQNLQTKEVVHFYLFKSSARYHISQGTVNSALNKYKSFISQVKFLEIQKNLDWNYYLIKTDKPLVLLDQIIILQKGCREIMDKDYMLRTIKFLIQIYKQKRLSLFPQLTPKFLGIDREGQLKICDYNFYSNKKFQMRSLTENICSCINPMLKISLARSSSKAIYLGDEYQRIKEYYGEHFANLIKAVLLDPMDQMEKECVINGQGKSVCIDKIQKEIQDYYKEVQNDLNATLNKTFDEQTRGEDRQNIICHSDLLTNDSIKQALIPQGQISQKKSHKKSIKTTALILMLVLLIAGITLFFFYYSKESDCDAGTFKSVDTKECISCSEGCLRCGSQNKNSCFSCSGKMYLVLNNENDTTGTCQSTCVGIVLKIQKLKTNSPENGTTTT